MLQSLVVSDYSTLKISWKDQTTIMSFSRQSLCQVPTPPNGITSPLEATISLTYAYKENYAWRLFLDYDYTRKTYTMTYNPSLFALDAISLGIGDESAKFSELLTPEDLSELTEHQSIKKNRHTFILGGSFTVSF